MRQEVVWIFAMVCSMSVFAADTELTHYRPLIESTNYSAVVIATKKTGECRLQSQLIKREDAWQCVAEGKVYDPCFVELYGSHLEAVCPESPWLKNAVQIIVSAPLDNKQHESLDMSRTFPWAVELTSGEKCQAVATTAQYDGLPVRYHCEGNSELIGHVQRCDSMWKMLQHASGGVDTVQISRAWF